MLKIRGGVEAEVLVGKGFLQRGVGKGLTEVAVYIVEELPFGECCLAGSMGGSFNEEAGGRWILG
jgi:hypothetical protein